MNILISNALQFFFDILPTRGFETAGHDGIGVQLSFDQGFDIRLGFICQGIGSEPAMFSSANQLFDLFFCIFRYLGYYYIFNISWI